MPFDLANAMVFSKHLGATGPVRDVCTAIAARVRRIGIKSVDLTVRPNGHVDPARVEEDLPIAQAVFAEHGVKIGMLTTGITEADAVSERVLRTAASLGIKTYKLGYFIYQGFGTIAAQRREVAARFTDVAAMNKSLGIHGGYHNHSDIYFGANLSDIAIALAGIDKRYLGIYLDPCHAVIEGGSQGWLMAIDHIAESVSMLAVKDFRWVQGKRAYAGARCNSVEFCTLADGNTPWPEVIAMLDRVGFAGPMSFHSEYQGTFSFRDLDFDGVAEQTTADLKVFAGWLNTSRGIIQ